MRRVSKEFAFWKSKVMRFCVYKYLTTQDPNLRKDLETLMTRLQYARTRDLPTLLYLIHQVSKGLPEILDLLPTEEEIEMWKKTLS